MSLQGLLARIGVAVVTLVFVLVFNFFLIRAGLYFLIVVPYSHFAAKKAAAEPPPEVVLLTEIRDLLKAGEVKAGGR